MGILNVDNLRAVGSGTTVTCLSNRLETTNINASGIITATSFDGGLPITDGSSWRVVTSSSANALKGEQNLQFDGTDLYVSDFIKHKDDTDTKLGFPSANAVDIFAGGKQVRLTSDGYLGINRTTPVAPISARRTDAGGTGTNGVTAEFANSSGYGVWFGQASASGAAWGATTGDFYWNTGGLSSQVERLRIASTGNVSIGDNPSVHSDTLFHVEKPSGETNVKFEGNTTTLGARLSLQNNNTAAGALNQIDFNDAGGQSTSTIKGFNTDQTNNYGYLSFCTRNAQGAPPTERMRIDKDGFVTKPYNCGFCAYSNGLWEPSGTGDIWVTASFTKQFDTNNDFDTSDNTFTAPVAGRYMFHLGFRHQFTQGGYVWVYLKKNGSSFSNMHVTIPQTSANMWHEGQAIFGIMSLAANDEIRPQISVNYAGIAMRGFQFSGYLLG